MPVAFFVFVLDVALVSCPEVSALALEDPALSPAFFEQTGHAPGPWEASVFSATAICWALLARSARGAYDFLRTPPRYWT